MANTETALVEDQRAQIGLLSQQQSTEEHTEHPDAQWSSSDGLGVFLHLGISSVNGDGAYPGP